MSRLQTALQVAGLGFDVFPIAHGQKGPPLLVGWPEKATRDPATINEWWTVWPNANIGIHCRGLVVIDVDVRNGGDETYAKLAAEHPLPPTLTNRTPTGGRHIIYKLPEGHPGVPNGAEVLGPGLDIKSTGGYIMSGGSEVATGKYKFIANIPVAPAPKWLVARLGERKAGEKAAPGAVVADANELLVAQAREWLSTQAAGEGAYATACGLRDRGLSLEQSLGLMAEHDPRPNVPGKVEHAYRYAQGAPGAKVAVDDDFAAAPAVGIAPAGIPAPLKLGLTPRPLPFGEWATGEEASEYVVKGLLSRASYAVMAGPPGAGKTFCALSIARHVAAGQEWHGHRVKQGTVLYLAFEGMGGMKKRGAALRQHYGDKDLPLYLMHGRMNVRTPEGRRDLATAVALMPEVPSLIVVDTFARAMMGGDENSAQDVGAFNEAMEGLMKATGACVLVLHHPPKSGQGLRGSGALLGAVDTEIEINERRITVMKQRDFDYGPPMGFRLVPIMVGFDADGDEITSCVLLTAEVPKQRAVKKLKGVAADVFEVLCAERPNNDPITKAELEQKCEAVLPLQRPGRALYRALLVLQRVGLVVAKNDMIERRLE